MSRLSDRINEAVDLARESGPAVLVHQVANALLPALDIEDREQLALEGLCVRVKTASMRGKAEIQKSVGAGQRELPFNLAAAYALDIEERQVKATRELQRHELRRVIAIREESVAADMRSLNELKRAYEAVAPIFDAHPDWLLGQALDVVAAMGVEAA